MAIVEVLDAVAARRAHAGWRAARGRAAPGSRPARAGHRDHRDHRGRPDGTGLPDRVARAIAARLAPTAGLVPPLGRRAAGAAGTGRSRRSPVGAAAVALPRSEALDLVADLVDLADHLAREGARLESLAVEAAAGRVLESLLGAGSFEGGQSAAPSS